MWWMMLLACGTSDSVFSPGARSDAFETSSQLDGLEHRARTWPEALARAGFDTTPATVQARGFAFDATRDGVSVTIEEHFGGDAPQWLTIELASTSLDSDFGATVAAVREVLRAQGVETRPHTKPR